MIFRGVDNANDWLFGQGIQSYFTNNDAIAADIKTTLQQFYQECFYDPNSGVPWFSILGQKSADLLILTLQNAILNVDGVTRVIALSYQLDENRAASVSYVVSTVYSSNLSGEINL